MAWLIELWRRLMVLLRRRQMEADLEEDHMEAVSQLLQELDDDEAVEALQPVRHHLRYDLCPECRQRYLENPLSKDPNKEAVQKFDFSEN